MNRMVIAVALMALSWHAGAADKMQMCKTYSDLAETVMKARQAGVSMSRAMEVVSDDPAVRELVIMAYDEPRMSVEKNQQRSIEDFRDSAYLACIKSGQ